MEIKSVYYHQHLNDRCKDIPSDALTEIIDEFSENAKFYMSSEVDSSTSVKINAVTVDMLKNQKYKFLPLYLVGEAFTKGSLGDLGGTTRFTVRNVCIWLNAITEKLQNINAELKTKEDDARRAADLKSFKQSQRNDNLFGKAMFLKINWRQAGMITSDEWDTMTLDLFVARFRAGETEHTLKPSMLRR